jgi:hypothetical protein
MVMMGCNHGPAANCRVITKIIFHHFPDKYGPLVRHVVAFLFAARQASAAHITSQGFVWWWRWCCAPWPAAAMCVAKCSSRCSNGNGISDRAKRVCAFVRSFIRSFVRSAGRKGPGTDANRAPTGSSRSLAVGIICVRRDSGGTRNLRARCSEICHVRAMPFGLVCQRG